MNAFEVYVDYGSFLGVCSTLPMAELEERMNAERPREGDRWAMALDVLQEIERDPAPASGKPGRILYDGPQRCEKTTGRYHYWFRRQPA